MYQLELDKVVEAIKQKDAKQVVIQLPDGLKPKAKEIVDKIEATTDAEVAIWFSSCYGGCDIPVGLQCDLLIQFGHNRFQKEEW